jgi:hypothetical protein
MTDKVTLTLRADDAEPILREAAREAASYSALCDHMTKRTVGLPCHVKNIDERKKEWQAAFLRAKRIVESFGVEYDATSEAETLGVYIPDKVLKSHIVRVAGVAFRRVDKSVPDPKNAMPLFRGAVHSEACKAAAARVVGRWRKTLTA